MEKEFSHEKKEVCKICKKEIDTYTEHWIAVNGYDGQEHKEKWFSHVACFNDLVKGKGEKIESNVQNKIFVTAKQLLNNIMPYR